LGNRCSVSLAQSLLVTHTLTFALHDISGAVEVSGCVTGTGDTVILANLPLICPHWTADAAVCAGVVEMSRRALDCRSQAQ